MLRKLMRILSLAPQGYAGVNVMAEGVYCIVHWWGFHSQHVGNVLWGMTLRVDSSVAAFCAAVLLRPAPGRMLATDHSKRFPAASLRVYT